jgi:hypothetical protein
MSFVMITQLVEGREQAAAEDRPPPPPWGEK